MDKLQATVHGLIGRLYDYWQHELEQHGDIIDHDLDRPTSCATAFQVAALFVAAHRVLGTDSLDEARHIVVSAARRQNADGSFGQPYYVPAGEPDTVDIAEIGASGRALYYLGEAGVAEAVLVLQRAADFLVSQVHPQRPGVIYKRPDVTYHDVLNGDAYAGDTLYWTSLLTGEAEYARHSRDVIAHLARRFGKVEAGWWQYAEDWEGRSTAGNNVAYQGTVIAFTAPWYKNIGDESVVAEYEAVLAQAMRTVLDQLALAPADRDEDKNIWWAIRDHMTWETALACWHRRHDELAGAELLLDYLSVLHDAWPEHGAALFDPPGPIRPDPNRAAIATRFRRLATASGALTYMALS